MKRARLRAALETRRALTDGPAVPSALDTALRSVPASDRDAWWDAVCDIEDIPNDGPHLPRGGVPYLPSSVTTVLELLDLIELGPDDVFVDVGSGLGRVLCLVHLLTGARARGIEVQPQLVGRSREIARQLNATGVSVVEGDAAALTSTLADGTVFFLYSPFSGDRLRRLIEALRDIASHRCIHIACVGLTLPEADWLETVSASADELTVYRSTP